jgi:hypothetical protein
MINFNPDEIPEDPRPLLNQLSALAADLPGCAACDSVVDLVELNNGTFGLAVHHQDECPWMAEQAGDDGIDATVVTRRLFTRAELEQVQRERDEPL